MECRVCGKNDFKLVLDLKDQPLGNIFLSKEYIGNEPLYPLRLIYCNYCQTSQLDYTVKKEIVYTDHTYLSGMTKVLKDHFKKIAVNIDTRFFKDVKRKSVLDIGSNDGTQLLFYKELGYEVLGVEATKRIAAIANQNQIQTLQAFFNLKVAKSLSQKFDVINAAGVFFHLEEFHSACDGIKHCLNDDGVFVVQFLYMKNIMENTAFDQIYHEHLLYYTLKTLNVLLNQHGMELFDAEFSTIHGGSIIGYVSHQGKWEMTAALMELRRKEEEVNVNELYTYHRFAEKVKTLRDENLRFLIEAKQKGKTIYGMGAPIKGNTLLNYFNIGSHLLEILVEKNELRRNLFSPGKHIPIVIEKELIHPPDVYYVLAWNFREEILKNNRKLISQGVEFYFPIIPAI